MQVSITVRKDLQNINSTVTTDRRKWVASTRMSCHRSWTPWENRETSDQESLEIVCENVDLVQMLSDNLIIWERTWTLHRAHALAASWQQRGYPRKKSSKRNGKFIVSKHKCVNHT